MYRKVSALLLTASLSVLVACSSSSSDEEGDGGTTGGTTDGSTDGTTGGTTDGNTDGTTGGTTDGNTDGTTGGTTDGNTDGTTGGTTDGTDGGSTDGMTGDTVTGNANMWGTITIEQLDDDSVELDGVFISTGSTAFPSATLLGAYQPSGDECVVSRTSIDDFGDPTDDIPDIGVTDFQFVSAGQAIPFISSAGSFAELQAETTPAETVGGFTIPATVFYEIPETTVITGPVPTGLTANITGDVFPAFLNAPVPDVAQLQVQTPTDTDVITPDTVFTWTAGSNPNAYIDISTSITEFGADFTSFESVFVNCTVSDDGSFSFPSATQAEMGAGFSASSATISRSAFSASQSGSAILLIFNNSTVEVGTPTFGF